MPQRDGAGSRSSYLTPKQRTSVYLQDLARHECRFWGRQEPYSCSDIIGAARPTDKGLRDEPFVTLRGHGAVEKLGIGYIAGGYDVGR